MPTQIGIRLTSEEGLRWSTRQRVLHLYNATRAGSGSPPAGRRRFHVFSFEAGSSFRSANRFTPLPAKHACAPSRTAAFRNLLLENCRLPLSSDCVHLASAYRNASPCEEAPRSEDPICFRVSLTNEAGSSPFGARSVGESMSRLLPCQARSCLRVKKSSVAVLGSYVTSPNRRRCALVPDARAADLCHPFRPSSEPSKRHTE